MRTRGRDVGSAKDVTDDQNRLRRCALEVMLYMPLGSSDALAALDLIRDLIEWREGGTPEAR
jgi:hypothetical protein